MSLNDNNEYELITKDPDRVEEIFPEYSYHEEEIIDCLENKDINTDYLSFNEDQLSDLKIDFYIEYNKQLLNSDFNINDIQEKSFKLILDQLSDMFPPKNFKLIFTQERELQLFRKQMDVDSSLIIDEFGGISLAIIGKKGLGYKYDYLNADQIDIKNIYLFTQYFLGNSFS